MSILIEGMDMPTGNSTKNVLIYSDGTVFTGHENDAQYSACEFKSERKTGKWGEHGECPFCSYLRQWEYDRFCGNCGARMTEADV